VSELTADVAVVQRALIFPFFGIDVSKAKGLFDFDDE